MECKLVII